LLRLTAVGDNAAMIDPPEADLPKRKRRWFQFSLRTLLLFVLICAIGCAWLAQKMKQKRIEIEATDAILKYGGTAFYEYQFDKDGQFATHGKPAGPVWLRSLIVDNFVCEVTAVQFAVGREIKTGGLEELSRLPKLTKLDLIGTRIDDAGLDRLKGLTQLRDLWVESTKVTDPGVKDLQEALPNCRIHR
jgi:hypothetical protein